jgi:hypothetical protein
LKTAYLTLHAPQASLKGILVLVITVHIVPFLVAAIIPPRGMDVDRFASGAAE